MPEIIYQSFAGRDVMKSLVGQNQVLREILMMLMIVRLENTRNSSVVKIKYLCKIAQ